MSEAALRRAELTVLAVHPVTISNWTGKPATVASDQVLAPVTEVPARQDMLP
jgi:hypothetical protein